MRGLTKTVLGLLTLGATGAVIFWRSQQQDNNKAKTRKPSDEVRQRLDATAGSPLGGAQKPAHMQATDQQKVHTDATDQRIAAPSIDMQRGKASVTPVSSAQPTSSAAVPEPSATASVQDAELVSAPSDAPAESDAPVISDASAPEAAPVSASSDDAPTESNAPVTSEAPAPEAAPVSASSDDAPTESDAPDSAPAEPTTDAAPVESDAPDSAPAEPTTDAAPVETEHLNPIAAMSNDQAAHLSAADLAPKNDPDAGQLESDGDDRTTTDRIRSNLGRQLDMGELPRLNINVQAGGEAYLRGSVQTMLHSELVEQVVRETDGVTKVVNELIVEEDMSNIEQTPSAPEPLENIPNITPKDDADAGELDADGDDRTTTDRVLSHLGRELHGDHLSRINVNTQAGGVVYLRGVVKSQEQRERIHQLVSGIDGVGDIVDELTVEDTATSA